MPTISQSSRQAWGKRKPGGTNCAVAVRATGKKNPIFFAPAATGDYSYVFALAPHIDDDYPIYVLPWHNIGEQHPRTLEEMAYRLTRMLVEVQPSEPYRLAGYSAGGLLAYAVAQQLLGEDKYVSHFFLLDTTLKPQIEDLYQQGTPEHAFLAVLKADVMERGIYAPNFLAHP